MSPNDRRRFLQAALAAAGSAATEGSFAQTVLDALAIPANFRTGTIRDVEHIVILMQENRSFDHYFGTLRGVRGFGDPRPVTLPNGKPVWYQPNGSGYVLPFHPGAANLGLQFLEDLAHNWQDTHAAWNKGRYDQWIPSKGTTTMAYLTRQDIPFHYQLADAFTICDAYHCSFMGSTDPNRYYMWTGWTGNDGQGGGPVLNNAETGYGWSTYPEVLEKAGVSWKIYQDVGVGLDAAGFWGWTEDPYIGNYGDNSLLYFHQYQNAQPGSPLYEKARTGTNISVSGTLFDVLKKDVAAGTLPQVSWIVAPEAYTEHPNWPANYGAWYVEQVLKTLTSNRELWSKTAVFITYDENDGFFDHVVPPYAPHTNQDGASTIDTVNEYYPGDTNRVAGPYGLGPRVPMIIVSPWTRGGWSCSQVFDHTSLIRFIEQRFAGQLAVTETNISPWRRVVCGDLSSAFNFAHPNSEGPVIPKVDTSRYAPPDRQRHADYVPVPPADQSLPKQERGLRRARALPYQLVVTGRVDSATPRISIDFDNTGAAGASFLVNAGDRSDGPWAFTIEAGRRLSYAWSAQTATSTGYDFSVHGPNGFLCQFKGKFRSDKDPNPTEIELSYTYDASAGNIRLRVTNRGATTRQVSVANAYDDGEEKVFVLKAGGSAESLWVLAESHGWYDLSVTTPAGDGFLRRIAGHVETGLGSFTDPAIGRG